MLPKLSADDHDVLAARDDVRAALGLLARSL